MGRRGFLKLFGTGLGSTYLLGCASSFKPLLRSPESTAAENYSPINRQSFQTSQFEGDRPELIHKVLWDKQAFLASSKLQPSGSLEKAKLVVIGGGMSGLISAYFLKDLHPIVLEQAARFGGNSKGENWNGLEYSIGAAYCQMPKPGSLIERFWQDIGVLQKARITDAEGDLILGGKIYRDVWNYGTVTGTQEQFGKLNRHLLALAKGQNHLSVPEIPAFSHDERKRVNDLDQMSVQSYLEQVLEGPLHPHLERYIEQYFWTSSAGSYSEVSAAAGLNFLAGDYEAKAVFRGGNAAIAEATFNSLWKDLGSSRLRPSSCVFDVRLENTGVMISYLDDKEQVKQIRAEQVIMACPKFVVAKIMNQLEQERVNAIQSVKYRSFLVANVWLNEGIDDSIYDLFFIDYENEPLKGRVAEVAKLQKATDMIHGTFANADPSRAVLTLGRSFPYDGARAELYSPDAYQKYLREFEEQIETRVLPTLKKSKRKVVDIRLARWGHPLPLSEVGNISSGKIDRMRKPFEDRIFFVEQDNWTLPCFEVAFHEAHFWSQEIRKRI